MKKAVLAGALIVSILAFSGCNENHQEKHIEPPKELFNPEDAFAEIPHDGFEAKWLEGVMIDEDSDSPVYEETYDFVLSMEKAVIPYTVSGTLIQTCEYSPSKERWKVECRTDDVIQEMDLSTYQWVLEESSFDYTETFVKNGPNTFATGNADHPTEPFFTVDIMSGGADLKDENGQTNLPGGQWAARLYIESPSYPKFRGEAAIDLISGSYGYNDSRWIVPLSELRRVEREENMTDEDRAKEEQELFSQIFRDADTFEKVEISLIRECNRELDSMNFGNVGVDKAAVARNRAGVSIGWVVQTYSEDSFGGKVLISVAIKRDGTINGLDFLLLQDTPGLGMRAEEKEFRGQFIGKDSEFLTVTTSGNAGDSEIDAISGATVTSNAVTNAVNAALYYVHNFTGDTDR